MFSQHNPQSPTLVVLLAWTVFCLQIWDPLDDGAHGWEVQVFCTREKTGRMYPHQHLDLQILADRPAVAIVRSEAAE